MNDSSCATMTTNPRINRFRKIVNQSILVPDPLPLINLPEESRLARTGVPNERPMNLPIRRLLPNPVAITTLKAKTDGQAVDFDGLQPSKPEPILRENRALLNFEAEEYEELEVLARLHVYEYNQPNVYRDSKAPDDTLVFDSLFESGNLLRAERIIRNATATVSGSRISQQEYELLIHPDVKNGAYRQWFYFEVRNGRRGVTYRFTLVNLAKSGALFGQGLQPVVYSEQDAVTKGFGWRHRGTHVRYDVAVSPMAPPGANALTFQYEFENENDCVYFACIQPYTYTDLMDYLEQLERDPQRSLTCRRTELCQSLAGNSCDLISVTSSGKDGLPHDERRMSARVHPGEPNSSWMMKGMMDYLTGSSSGATVLRRNFIFKMVPMLNPDGVINGNTRVSLAGWDLNRKWSSPIEQLFPTIYHLKQQLAHFQTRGRVAIYCDLHGHSINRNVFTYGCYNSKKVNSPDGSTNTTSSSSTGVKKDPRVFPMIVARHALSFSFGSCDFTVHKSKVTTARVVVNQELGVTNSYTLEASFCGPDFGTRKDTQFSIWDLEEMGRSWCQSLIIYYGLTAQVKALDVERARQANIDQLHGSIADAPSPTSRQNVQTPAEAELHCMDADDEESRLARDLLLDCEAAISALFSHSEVDADGREGSGEDDEGAVDSDLSGAEEEPIPPSLEGAVQQPTSQIHSEPIETNNDDVQTTDGHEGYLSAPEELSTTKIQPLTTGPQTRKKAARRRHTRASRSKSVGPTSRKSDKTKKSKRKSKPELRRTYSTTAAPPLESKPEDATTSTNFEKVLTADSDSTTKPLTSRSISARRTKTKSARPRTSIEVPKSVSSAILQATMSASLTSRANIRQCPIPTHPNTENSGVLVLPSVVDGIHRAGSVGQRILKTAPIYSTDCPAVEKPNFNFARMGSELPILQLTGRDEEHRRRLSRRQTFRRQDSDDTQQNEDSNSKSGPESYASNMVSI